MLYDKYLLKLLFLNVHINVITMYTIPSKHNLYRGFQKYFCLKKNHVKQEIIDTYVIIMLNRKLLINYCI